MKQKYEYSIVEEFYDPEDSKTINEKAKQGWEAVSLTRFTGNWKNRPVYAVLMRREKKKRGK
jgi:hypothetical protein